MVGTLSRPISWKVHSLEDLLFAQDSQPFVKVILHAAYRASCLWRGAHVVELFEIVQSSRPELEVGEVVVNLQMSSGQHSKTNHGEHDIPGFLLRGTEWRHADLE